MGLDNWNCRCGMSEWKSLSHVRLFSTPWNSPGQNTEVDSLSLLQGIFPTQGSNPGLPHCRRVLYQLSHKGSPRILEWIGQSSLSLLPQIFPTWEWNRGIVHCKKFLYQLCHLDLHPNGKQNIAFLSIGSVIHNPSYGALWETKNMRIKWPLLSFYLPSGQTPSTLSCRHGENGEELFPAGSIQREGRLLVLLKQYYTLELTALLRHHCCLPCSPRMFFVSTLIFFFFFFLNWR